LTASGDPLAAPCDFQVRIADVKRWAQLLDDDNPLHRGDAQVVNPGPASLAYLISFLRRCLPEARLLSVKCRFLAALHAPGVARAHGRIVRIEPVYGVLRIWCALELSSGERIVAAADAVLETAGVEGRAA
jgi:hypothetical protein